MFKWDMDNHIKFSYIVFFFEQAALRFVNLLQHHLISTIITMPFFSTYPGLLFLNLLVLWCCSWIYIYINIAAPRELLASPKLPWPPNNLKTADPWDLPGRSSPSWKDYLREEWISELMRGLCVPYQWFYGTPSGSIRNRKWRALNCVYWWLVMGFQLLHTVAADSWWLKTAQNHSCTYQGRSRMSLKWLIKLWCTKDRLAKIFLEVSPFSSGNIEGANGRERERERKSNCDLNCDVPITLYVSYSRIFLGTLPFQRASS